MRSLLPGRLAIGAALLFVAVLAGCGSSTPPAPTTVTVTAPPTAPAGTTAATPPKRVTIPDVVGDNGSIALDKLTEAGLTKVQTATRDATNRVVLNPANWTVTKVEPKAGTAIQSDRTVVVTMTKE